MEEKYRTVPSELVTKASEGVEKQVAQDLKVPDPPQEKAKAILQSKENDNDEKVHSH